MVSEFVLHILDRCYITGSVYKVSLLLMLVLWLYEMTFMRHPCWKHGLLKDQLEVDQQYFQAPCHLDAKEALMRV